MFKSKWNIVLVLAACALLLATTVSAKKQVERPFNIRGDVTVVFAPYYAWATGVATHTGKYRSEAIVEGKAILTAANGDQLFWTEDIGTDPLNPLAFTMTCTIYGGTGRFLDASGSFGPVIIPYSELIYNEDGSISFSYSASGTITY